MISSFCRSDMPAAAARLSSNCSRATSAACATASCRLGGEVPSWLRKASSSALGWAGASLAISTALRRVDRAEQTDAEFVEVLRPARGNVGLVAVHNILVIPDALRREPVRLVLESSGNAGENPADPARAAREKCTTEVTFLMYEPTGGRRNELRPHINKIDWTQRGVDGLLSPRVGARQQSVHCDAMLLALDRHRTRQTREAALGCVVGRVTQIAEDNTVDRADVENTP